MNSFKRIQCDFLDFSLFFSKFCVSQLNCSSNDRDRVLSSIWVDLRASERHCVDAEDKVASACWRSILPISLFLTFCYCHLVSPAGGGSWCCWARRHLAEAAEVRAVQRHRRRADAAGRWRSRIRRSRSGRRVQRSRQVVVKELRAAAGSLSNQSSAFLSKASAGPQSAGRSQSGC